MKVSEVLREAEKQLPWAANDGPSYYICDTIYKVACGRGAGKAMEFLQSLGMGGGFFVFAKTAFEQSLPRAESNRIQCERHAWLLFAADLADEWGVE